LDRVEECAGPFLCAVGTRARGWSLKPWIVVGGWRREPLRGSNRPGDETEHQTQPNERDTEHAPVLNHDGRERKQTHASTFAAGCSGVGVGSRPTMRYAVLLGVGAVGFGLLAWQVQSPAVAWAPAWLAFGFGVAAIGYAGAGPGVFGKRANGTRAPWAYLVVGPFLLVSQFTRLLQLKLLGENPYDRVAPGLYVGRLIGRRRMPADVRTVVDMTSEFLEAPAIRAELNYLCLPTLDGTAHTLTPLLPFAQAVLASEGPHYIHCAAGHGRSSMVAAIVLVVRGEADTVDAAEAQMKSARPRVHLGRAQHRAATTTATALLALEPAPSSEEDSPTGVPGPSETAS
jgi:hypothetical protein